MLKLCLFCAERHVGDPETNVCDSVLGCFLQVWDTLGRLLYQSAPLLSPVTALAWSPSAEVFTVGSYNSLLLCHASGWLVSKVGIARMKTSCYLQQF